MGREYTQLRDAIPNKEIFFFSFTDKYIYKYFHAQIIAYIGILFFAVEIFRE